MSAASSAAVAAAASSGSSASAAAAYEALADKREIGNEAVWTLSTAKPGNGVEQLRDGNVDTFWQSDGPQPHLINIQFHKKMRVANVAIYTEYKLDESYTPAKLAIRAGTGFHDLQEVQLVELDEPSGWVTVRLSHDDDDDDGAGGDRSDRDHVHSLRAHLLQIAVLSSHQNGRDTHVRQVRVYGPRPPATKGFGTELSQFSSVEFDQFAAIR
jgi:anaphase-promoting complex subunit 10